MGDIDIQGILFRLLGLLIAIPVHEFAHALSAVNNGDDGPRREGRLTIFPWDHFDPIGGLFCVISTISGFGLGWGRPVMVNPNALKDPRWSMCKIAAWGPFSNLLLAILFALPLRFLAEHLDLGLLRLLVTFVQLNLALMLFNLIPIGPLDGAKVLVAFLPERQAYEFSRFQAQFGMIILFVLISVGRGALALLIGPPLDSLMGLLIGPLGQ